VGGGMLWRNGCDGKVLRCGAGNRHQQDALCSSYSSIIYTIYFAVRACLAFISVTRVGLALCPVALWVIPVQRLIHKREHTFHGPPPRHRFVAEAQSVEVVPYFVTSRMLPPLVV
jgi:hypothetical protein